MTVALPARVPNCFPPALGERVAALAAREHEVMTLALKGLPNKVIARQLGLSYRTIESHRRRLLKKLGLRSITELTRRMLDQ